MVTEKFRTATFSTASIATIDKVIGIKELYIVLLGQVRELLQHGTFILVVIDPITAVNNSSFFEEIENIVVQSLTNLLID